MKKIKRIVPMLFLMVMFSSMALAGPYSDDGIAGFVGPDGEGVVSDDNYVNPVFKAWATGYSYNPFDLAEIQSYQRGDFADPAKTLGEVTGSNFDIASLGDMDATEIANWQSDPDTYKGPGEITLNFDTTIYNGDGCDFAVFENSFGSASGVFAELGYVEVSTDGDNFARFDSISLTEGLVGGYGTIDPDGCIQPGGKACQCLRQLLGDRF